VSTKHPATPVVVVEEVVAAAAADSKDVAATTSSRAVADMEVEATVVSLCYH
jgi:hypothetical protein